MKFFLDIDGVMVHANPGKRVEFDEDGFYKFNTAAVEVLNSVIDSDGDDELILSTSHRFRFSVGEWKNIFLSRGIHIGNISIIDIPVQNKVPRRTEIVTWINEHHLDAKDIVIIDDDKSLNELPSDLKERLVLTNSYVGLNYSSDLKKMVTKGRNKSKSEKININPGV